MVASGTESDTCPPSFCTCSTTATKPKQAQQQLLSSRLTYLTVRQAVVWLHATAFCDTHQLQNHEGMQPTLAAVTCLLVQRIVHAVHSSKMPGVPAA